MAMSRSRYILTLILIHTIIILGILVYVIASGADYHKILLIDDGYYKSAGEIVRGESLSTWFGLGWPLMLTVVYLFPVSLHPFLRLLISLLFTYGTIVLVFKIFKHYFTDKEIFLGGLFFVANPLYVHWMFKSRIEAPLILLLGLIIFCSQLYLLESKIRYPLLASLFLAISVFTKPVFMLISLFVAVISYIILSMIRSSPTIPDQNVGRSPVKTTVLFGMRHFLGDTL